MTELDPILVLLLKYLNDQLRCHCGRDFYASLTDSTFGCSGGHNLTLGGGLKVFRITDKVVERLTDNERG